MGLPALGLLPSDTCTATLGAVMKTPSFEFWVHLLWFCQPFLKAAIAGLLYWRRDHRRYPLFFSTLIYMAIVSALLMQAGHVSYKTYFYAFWALKSVEVVLYFAVIYELFTVVFGHHHGLKDFGTTLFQWAGILSTIMAMVMIATSASAVNIKLISTVVLNLQRAVSV